MGRNLLLTVSKDKAIDALDEEQGQLERQIPKAHSAPINSLLLVDEDVLVTGDDTGGIPLWDQRKEGPLMDIRRHKEHIADMALHPAKKLPLTASGGGCLASSTSRDTGLSYSQRSNCHRPHEIREEGGLWI
jgi:WD40 repeat protein